MGNCLRRYDVVLGLVGIALSSLLRRQESIGLRSSYFKMGVWGAAPRLRYLLPVLHTMARSGVRRQKACASLING